MHQISLEDARERLDDLIEEVANGEDVIITRGDGSAFKIVPALVHQRGPVFGSGKGTFEIADDFDEPLEDFDPYMR